MTPFGRRVRELREKRGITLAQMAEGLGVTPAYLSALEHGKRGRPTFTLIQGTIHLLGIIWDEADELVRLADLSHPRVTVDTVGLDAEATLFANRLAREIDTLDAEGEVVATSDNIPDWGAIEDVLVHFIGEIEQIPPAYSALKIAGRRAYDLARAGEALEMQPRKVTIHNIDYLMEGMDEGVRWAKLRAHVSKGTYIRSLARDIAHALDTVGHVTMLRRTRAGPFGLDSAISLDKLSEAAKARSLEDYLLPLTAGLDDIPALPVTPDQAGALRQGRILTGIAAQPGLHLATDNDVPVALVELSGDELRVVRGFNL